jgi:ElaB/YqjD/DUF883 family membrane-anchored ribosome-binding protein
MRTDRRANRKIHEALTLLGEAAAEKKSDLQTLIADRYAQFRDFLDTTQAGLSEAAHHGMDRVAEAKDAAAVRVGETAARVDRYVRNDPWQSLGWVAFAAFAVGYLLGHRKGS